MKKAFMDVSKILEKEKFKIDEKKYRGFVVKHFCVDYKSEKLVKRVRGDYFSIIFEQFAGLLFFFIFFSSVSVQNH